MQRRKRYGIGYVLVLLAAVGGFLIARNAVSDFEPPTLRLPASVRQVADELDVFGLLARLMPAPAPASATASATPTRAAPPPVVQGIETTPAPPATVAPTAPAPPATTPAAPAEVAYPFALAGPLRHDGECSTASIRGSVRDAAGSLLAGVRIWRYDQWGNEEVRESSADEPERGQYAFTFGDTANVHYVQVIDAGGAIISPVVEVRHRQGDAADALCHWVDWQQQ